MKLSKAEQELTEALKPWLARDPVEKDGNLVFILKESAVADRQRYMKIRGMLMKVGATATATPPGFVIPFRGQLEPTTQPETVLDIKAHENQPSLNTHGLDVEALCVQELKRFFQETNRELIGQCIAYLADHGWNEQRFQSEIGVSKTTVWRYLNQTKVAQAVFHPETPA